MRIIESALKKSAEERERLLEVWELLGNPSRTVFMDIETTGFSRTYDTVYLIGLAFYRGGEFRVRPYLAAAEADEAKVLKSAVEDMMDFDTVVTYNGDMFDLPFIRERAKRMRVWTDEMQRWDMHVDSIDLLRRYRRYQSFFGWPNLKLKTVEACLGISRQDPFDGGQLIEVFYEYTRTDDERLESVLLLHNYEDIVNLLELLKAETMMGEINSKIDIEAVLHGVGVEVVERIDPLKLEDAIKKVKETADKPGVKAIIFESPCAMLFKPEKPMCVGDNCIDCRKCIKEIGCPGLIIRDGKVVVDDSLCNGCGLCSQICPVGAITASEGK